MWSKLNNAQLLSFYKVAAGYLGKLVDLVYPPFCVFCEARLTGQSTLICEICWQRLPCTNGAGLTFLPTNLAYVLSLWRFTDEVQRVIHELKFRGKKSLARRIGKQMAELASSRPEYKGAELVVPVPLHRIRLRERGFNQSQLLAKTIAESLNIEFAPRLLRRTRYTRTQTTLTTLEREKNVAGAFEVTDAQLARDRCIILVDDVLTTGSTLNACAECLLNAGATKVLVLTAAVVE